MRGDVAFMRAVTPGPSEETLHGLALVDIEGIEHGRQVDHAMQALGRGQLGAGCKQLAGAGDGEWLKLFRHVARRVVINPYVIAAGDLAPVNAKQLAELDEPGWCLLLFAYK